MTLTGEPPAEKRWYDVADAATYTSFSQHYIRDAANTGKLKGYRQGGGRSGHWRFLAEDLDLFVKGAVIGPRAKRSARTA